MRYTILLNTILTTTLLYSNISLPKSFNAKFKQTVTTDKRKKIIYNGNLLFSSPNSFKWEYKSPTEKEVCTDGVELLVVDHDLEQVSAYIIDKGLDLNKILQKAKPHHDRVYVAKYNNRNYTIALDNKDRLYSIAYRDDLDNIVSILFLNMQYNAKKITSSKLKCNYSANYDYIVQ